MKNKKMHKYISKVSEGTADARCSVHTHTHARTHTRGPRAHAGHAHTREPQGRGLLTSALDIVRTDVAF